MRGGDWGILAGGVIFGLCAFLPWATFGPIQMAGTTGDGQITLVLGVVIAVLAAVRLQGARVTAGILAVVGGGIVFFDLVNVQGLAQEPTLFGTVEPGFGLYLSLLTAGGILVSVVVAMQDRDGA